MKLKLVRAMVIGFSLTVVAHGQTGAPFVSGHGTPNYVPLWTGQRTIGNSILFQSGNSLGVGTTNPQAGLDVESKETFGILGGHQQQWSLCFRCLWPHCQPKW